MCIKVPEPTRLIRTCLPLLGNRTSNMVAWRLRPGAYGLAFSCRHGPQPSSYRSSPKSVGASSGLIVTTVRPTNHDQTSVLTTIFNHVLSVLGRTMIILRYPKAPFEPLFWTMIILRLPGISLSLKPLDQPFPCLHMSGHPACPSSPPRKPSNSYRPVFRIARSVGSRWNRWWLKPTRWLVYSWLKNSELVKG